MNPTARTLMIAATLALCFGLAGYAASRLTQAHARARHPSRAMYLGTIQVTPQDTLQRAARGEHADRYAGRSDARGSEAEFHHGTQDDS